MQEKENVGKAGSGTGKVSARGRLLAAKRSGNVEALQNLLGYSKSSGETSSTKPTVEELQTPEFSDKALKILDRQKERKVKSTKVRQKKAGKSEQSFLKSSQNSQVKRFKNPARAGR